MNPERMFLPFDAFSLFVRILAAEDPEIKQYGAKWDTGDGDETLSPWRPLAGWRHAWSTCRSICRRAGDSLARVSRVTRVGISLVLCGRAS